MLGLLLKLVLRHKCVIAWLMLLQPSALCGQDATKPLEMASRTWRDATRVFVIEAKLVELSGDKAKLRKADGSEIDVRREALSKEDQKYLAELDKTLNPFSTNPSVTAINSSASSKAPSPMSEPNTTPPPNTPQTSSSQTSTPQSNSPQTKTLKFSASDLPPTLPTSQNIVVYSPTTKLESLQTKPVEPMTVPPGEVFIANTAIGARLSPILVLDAKTRKVAISIGPPQYSSRQKTKSQVLIGEMPSGPFECLVEQEDPISLLDHNLTTGQTLSLMGRAGEEREGHLVLMEGLAEGQPVEVARFRLPSGEIAQRAISQAKLVGPNIALVVLDRIAYCWDLSTGKLIYQTEPKGFWATNIAFSGDMTLMAFPSDMGIHFANPLTGKDLGCLLCKDRPIMQIAFDPRSHSIGFVAGGYWGVYDYEKQTQIGPQITTCGLTGQVAGWIKPNLLLAGNGTVLDTEHQVPVWTYVAANLTNARIWSDTVTLVEDLQGIRLRTMPMPHADCLEAVEKLKSFDKYLTMDAGKAVHLQYELPDPLPKEVNRQEIEKRMPQIVKRAGWVLDDKASLKLVVKIATGAKRKEQYHKLEQIGNKTTSNVETVEITPTISRLELRSEDGKAIWWMECPNSLGNVSGPTKLSKEDFIREREKVFPTFFYDLVLPTRVLSQPFNFGLGHSIVRSGLWESTPVE